MIIDSLTVEVVQFWDLYKYTDSRLNGDPSTIDQIKDFFDWLDAGVMPVSRWSGLPIENREFPTGEELEDLKTRARYVFDDVFEGQKWLNEALYAMPDNFSEARVALIKQAWVDLRVGQKMRLYSSTTSELGSAFSGNVVHQNFWNHYNPRQSVRDAEIKVGEFVEIFRPGTYNRCVVERELGEVPNKEILGSKGTKQLVHKATNGGWILICQFLEAGEYSYDGCEFTVS